MAAAETHGIMQRPNNPRKKSKCRVTFNLDNENKAEDTEDARAVSNPEGPNTPATAQGSGAPTCEPRSQSRSQSRLASTYDDIVQLKPQQSFGPTRKPSVPLRQRGSLALTHDPMMHPRYQQGGVGAQPRSQQGLASTQDPKDCMRSQRSVVKEQDLRGELRSHPNVRQMYESNADVNVQRSYGPTHTPRSQARNRQSYTHSRELAVQARVQRGFGPMRDPRGQPRPQRSVGDPRVQGNHQGGVRQAQLTQSHDFGLMYEQHAIPKLDHMVRRHGRPINPLPGAAPRYGATVPYSPGQCDFAGPGSNQGTNDRSPVYSPIPLYEHGSDYRPHDAGHGYYAVVFDHPGPMSRAKSVDSTHGMDPNQPNVRPQASKALQARPGIYASGLGVQRDQIARTSPETAHQMRTWSTTMPNIDMDIRQTSSYRDRPSLQYSRSKEMVQSRHYNQPQFREWKNPPRIVTQSAQRCGNMWLASKSKGGRGRGLVDDGRNFVDFAAGRSNTQVDRRRVSFGPTARSEHARPKPTDSHPSASGYMVYSKAPDVNQQKYPYAYDERDN